VDTLIELGFTDGAAIADALTQTDGAGEKTALFEPFIYKSHIFTKTVRGKHRENSKKVPFSRSGARA